MEYLYKDGREIKHDQGLLFSYSITTVNDDTTTWANRMDHYI